MPPLFRVDIVRTVAFHHHEQMPKSRIMYIENKAGSLNGPARIGRVTFSKTGKSIHYNGRTYQTFRGYKANYFDVETGEEFWISGPRKDGKDRLDSENTQPVDVDDDVAEEYWRDIRGLKRAETPKR